jgi:hypothetical protein
VHALIFTAVCSRHMFVWLTFSQTLAALIAGCDQAWDLCIEAPSPVGADGPD